MDRYLRHRLFPDADGHRDHVAVLAGVPGCLPQRRGFHQCRRPDGLARAPHAAAGLSPPDPAGHLRAHQARRIPARPHSGSHGEGRRSDRRGAACRGVAQGAGGDSVSAFLVANMAPLMFASLIVVMLIGYPVAFALAATGVFFGLLGVELGLLSPALFQALPQRMWAVMSNDTLLAVPFFTFMGLILERSGMAEDLLDTVGQLFGPLRGGLAFAVIFVGALLAATTGVVAASVISMGLISLPIMLRYGYDRRFASGVIAASGTLAQIIPPSLVLIIMADQLGKSVGDMYAGAFIPGIALAGLYAAYTLAVAFVKPAWAPALPPEARKLQQPDGSSGLPSFAVVTVLAFVVAILFDRFYYVPAYPEAMLDERLVVAAAAGAAFALAGAFLDRLFKVGLLSRLAEQVVFVLIPPLALIF